MLPSVVALVMVLATISASALPLPNRVAVALMSKAAGENNANPCIVALMNGFNNNNAELLRLSQDSYTGSAESILARLTKRSPQSGEDSSGGYGGGEDSSGGGGGQDTSGGNSTNEGYAGGDGTNVGYTGDNTNVGHP
ncbi:hypothetical protein BV25DRAFT_1910955 [Artomyces pyxidatus]|uniref:Uncharacterized protein n=1 Tax=Artomyces pyxidatus TaxID=48021 RepID=A0ACB8TLD9_9AGAM|nr:hypothetical protein BV25DRAFT_1910955 [Artomyces pyxidatus]